jgi:hypothetical protein
MVVRCRLMRALIVLGAYGGQRQDHRESAQGWKT